MGKIEIEEVETKVNSLDFILGDPSDMIKDIYMQLQEIHNRLEALEGNK